MTDQELRLREEGIRSFEEPIHLQPKEWLTHNFGEGVKYAVNVNLLIRNIAWQVRTWIQKGSIQPLQGLIRNFWYSHIKPTLSRCDSLNTSIDQYDQVTQMLTRLVVYRDLLRYKDFGFFDVNAANRHIGRKGYVILFAEKHGHYPLIERIASEFDVTVISLGGQPSSLSAEYFVDEIKALGFDVRKSFYIFSMVDYDPSGWIIKDAFIQDLDFFGIRHVKVYDLVLPSILTPEEVELNKYELPDTPEMRKKNRKWMTQTGGINGQFYGLEADSVPPERLIALCRELIAPIVGSPESSQIADALVDLADSIDALVLAILQSS
jgi:hypothetical protein